MMYSAMGTTGLVIGVGTIGEYLSERPNDQQTFFSRDAGSTWKKVRWQLTRHFQPLRPVRTSVQEWIDT
jgi:hypothetical protein